MLQIINGSLTGKEFALSHEGEFVVGRSKGCAVRLPEELEFQTISRHHCVVAITEDEVHVHDAGSRNGSTINGMQIGRPAHWHVSGPVANRPFQDYQLHEGDELRIGGVAFRVSIPAEQAPMCCAPEDAEADMCGCL
jgi:pSer/pThr/pTyr-binding forkhead associated (FHA) protein